MKLNRDDITRYFEARIQNNRFTGKRNMAVRCVFHDDNLPSLSIDFEKGVWKCHAGCGSGGVLDFERKFSSCDTETAWSNIAEITGVKQQYIPGQKPEATYQYHDALGRVVFEKLRYPGKRFSQRRPDGKGGWIYKLDGVRKVLYNLPNVLVANEIVVAEGEKDAENAARALKSVGGTQSAFIAGTTNFDGAGKWKDSESVFFAGKRAVIFADNDEVGRKHAEQVATSIYPHAFGLRVVHFPELPEHGDVSDFLKTNTPEQLVALILKAPQWRPPETESHLLVQAMEFSNQIPDQVDWVVEGLIQKGANGFFVAEPKAGKSWAAIDLAVSLAMGEPWMGMNVPKPMKTALISREDTPGLTAWRLKRLFHGKQGMADLYQTNLWVNTKGQSPDYRLDVEELHREMIQELKRRDIQFAILDVFNVLHSADENDNQEMRAVLEKLNEIQIQTGCQLAVVHHFNKSEGGSLVRRIRGSSAISGWVEWAVGITVADQEMGVRKMEFETKADQPPQPIFYSIDAPKTSTTARLEINANYADTKKSNGKGSAAAGLMN